MGAVVGRVGVGTARAIIMGRIWGVLLRGLLGTSFSILQDSLMVFRVVETVVAVGVHQVVGRLVVGQAMSLLLTLVLVDATLIVDHMVVDQVVDLVVVLKQ